jgi:hypothetical protein
MHVRTDDSYDVELTVVAEDDEIGVLFNSRLTYGIKKLTEPQVGLFDSVLYAVTENAGFMPCVIDK